MEYGLMLKELVALVLCPAWIAVCPELPAVSLTTKLLENIPQW